MSLLTSMSVLAPMTSLPQTVLASSEPTAQLQQTATNMIDAIRSSNSPAFSAMKSFFSNPVESVKNLLSCMKSQDAESLFKLPTLSVKVIKEYLQACELNIEAIVIGLLVFIVLYTFIYKVVLTRILGYTTKDFFSKKLVTLAFAVTWVLLISLAYGKGGVDPGNNLRIDATFINLENTKVLLASLAIALVLSVGAILLCAYFLETLFALPVALGIAIFILCRRFDFTPTKQQVVIAGCVLGGILFVGVVLFSYLRAYTERIKESSKLLIRNIIPLFFFFLIISTLHFGAIRVTTSLWTDTATGFAPSIFIIFANAWIHFTISYFVTVFVSSILSFGIKEPKYPYAFGWIGGALYTCYMASDFICVCSLFSASIHTLISLVDTGCELLSGKTSILAKPVVFILSVIRYILKALLFIVDASNSRELIKMGILGFDGYFDMMGKEEKAVAELRTGAIGDDLFTKLTSSLVALLQGAPHILLSVASVTFLNMYVSNAKALFFSLFVASNIFIYFLYALGISSEVLGATKGPKAADAPHVNME